MIFDEKKLGEEIARVWGEHGAHAEVYRMLLAKASRPEEQPLNMAWSAMSPLEREAYHAGAAAAKQEERKIPDVLFDGHAVFLEVARHAGPEHTIKSHHVSAVLDAVVRIMRHPMNKERP